MKFSKFKTKTILTLGIYLFVWRSHVAAWLRDEFQAPLNPGAEVVSLFIPIYGLIVWWRFLNTIRATELAAGITEVLSPARAFWWSSLWFCAGPYVNKHLNALAGTRVATSAA